MDFSKGILELGAIAVIFLFAVKEFFSYLKLKKNGGGFNEAILKELQSMNNNHLNSLKDCVHEGNSQLTETIHRDNLEIIKLLGEIHGKLK